MSNPYYIPQQSTFADALNNSLQLGLQVYGLRQRDRLAKTELDLRERQIKEQERQGVLEYGSGTPGGVDFVPGLRQRAIEVTDKGHQIDEQRLGVEKQKLSATQMFHQQNFGQSDLILMETSLSGKGLGKAFEAVKEPFNTLAKTNSVDRLGAMQEMSTNWTFYKDKMLDGTAKDYKAKMEKDPNFVNTPEAKVMETFMATIEKTDEKGYLVNVGENGEVKKGGNVVRDFFFPRTMDSYMAEQETIRLSNEAKQAEISQKSRLTPENIYAERLGLPEGDPNRMTPEEVARAQHPTLEKPFGSAGGGVIYDTTTGKPTYVKPNAPKDPRKPTIVTGEDEKGQYIYNVDTKTKDYIGGAKPRGTGVDAQAEADKQAIRDKLLGKTPTSAADKKYKTAGEVQADYQAGKLDKARAILILQKQFGMK